MTPVIFAGGGTGGHIAPALAIHETLMAAHADVRTTFICSDRAIDARMLTDANVDFHPIRARPFSLAPRALACFTFAWSGAVRAARSIIRSNQQGGPSLVVAMGGFVGPPVVQAARAQRLPIILINLDAAPGLANRWIARHARTILTAAPTTSDWTRIPPIVRAGAIAPAPATECRRTLGLDPERQTLLVTGASQGARSINAFMRAYVERHADSLAQWQVIHQCGNTDADMLRSAYADAGVPAHVADFLSPMGPAWGAADLAVSRAGAGSVAEVWANCVPTIFMPYPFHRDQHQRHNAAVLGDGAIIVDDVVDAARNAQGQAGEALHALLLDPSRRERMHAALVLLGTADGARRAAEAIMGRASEDNPQAHP